MRLAPALAAAICVVALAACGAGEDDAKAPAGGPLSEQAGTAYAVYGVVGEPVFHGVAQVFNEGSEPVRLEGVELIAPTPGLRVEKVRVGGPARKGNPGGGPVALYERRGSAPTDVEPLKGAVLAPRASTAGRKGLEILVYMSAAQPGRYKYDGFYVSYRAGGELRRDRIRNAFAVCVDTSYDKASKEDCPSPGIPKL